MSILKTIDKTAKNENIDKFWQQTKYNNQNKSKVHSVQKRGFE